MPESLMETMEQSGELSVRPEEEWRGYVENYFNANKRDD